VVELASTEDGAIEDELSGFLVLLFEVIVSEGPLY